MNELKVAEEKSDNRVHRTRVNLAGLEASCSAFTEKNEKSSVFHLSHSQPLLLASVAFGYAPYSYLIGFTLKSQKQIKVTFLEV